MPLVNYKLQKAGKLFFISGLLCLAFVHSAFAEIESSLNSWAKAWSSQDVTLYFESYSEEFVSSKGLSREEWEKERKIRLITPDYIKVNLSDIKVNQHDVDFVDVDFIQHYQSNNYNDEVIKRLTMQKIDSQWLIIKEKVLKTDVEVKNLVSEHDSSENDLNSRAFPLGSLINIVDCSPELPLNLVVGSMTNLILLNINFSFN